MDGNGAVHPSGLPGGGSLTEAAIMREAVTWRKAARLQPQVPNTQIPLNMRLRWRVPDSLAARTAWSRRVGDYDNLGLMTAVFLEPRRATKTRHSYHELHGRERRDDAVDR
jgi:hypothetical protein